MSHHYLSSTLRNCGDLAQVHTQFGCKSKCQDLSLNMCGMDLLGCPGIIKLGLLTSVAYQNILDWESGKSHSICGTLAANASANGKMREHLVIADAKGL